MATQVGIGVTLVTTNGRLKISAMKPDGAAAASGNVRIDDLLVALNGVPVTSEAHAKELILGPFGTSLKAELSRGGQSVTVTLWRGGAEAKVKGEAAEKAKAESEAKAAAEAKAARRIHDDQPKDSLYTACITAQLPARSSDSHNSTIYAVSVSPIIGLGGVALIASNSHNDVKLWAVSPDGTGACTATLPTGHTYEIMALAFSPRAIHGDVIVLVSGGGPQDHDAVVFKVWGIRPDMSYSCLASLEDWHTAPVTSLAFNPVVFEDGSMQFFSGGWDRNLYTGTVRCDGSVSLVNRQVFPFKVQCLACSPAFDNAKSAFLALGFTDFTEPTRVIIWKSQSTLHHLCDYIHEQVYSIAFSEAIFVNDRPLFLLASGCENGIIKISAICPEFSGAPFDFRLLKTSLRAHSTFVWGLRFCSASCSQETIQLASCSGSYTQRNDASQIIKIWEISVHRADSVFLDAECKAIISGYEAPIWAVCFIPSTKCGRVTFLASATGEDNRRLSTRKDHAVTLYSLPVKSGMMRIFVNFSPGLLHGNANFIRVPVDLYSKIDVLGQIFSVAQELAGPILLQKLSFYCRGNHLDPMFSFADGDVIEAVALGMVEVSVSYFDSATVLIFLFDPVCTNIDVKKRIFARKGFAIERQVLMLADRILADDDTVVAGATVALSLSPSLIALSNHDVSPAAEHEVFQSNPSHFADAELYPWRTREFAAHFFQKLLCNRNPHRFLLHSPVESPHLLADILDGMVSGSFAVPELFLPPDKWNVLPQISKLLRSFKSVKEAQSVFSIWSEGSFDHTDHLGRFFIVEGGWQPPRESGHRVIYVIERNEYDNFSFSVCNSGEGLQCHPPRISSITVRNISKTKIQSMFLWKSLEKMESSSDNNRLLVKTQIGPQMAIEPFHILYRVLLPYLSLSVPFHDSTNMFIAKSESGYPQKPQAGNTCYHRAWLCALQFLMKRLGFSLFECKQVACFIRLRWLHNILDHLKKSANHLQINASDVHSIQTATLQTRRAVVKLFQRCNVEGLHHDLLYQFLQFSEEICENVSQLLESLRMIDAASHHSVLCDRGTFEPMTPIPFFDLPARCVAVSGCEFNCLNLLFLSEANMDEHVGRPSQVFSLQLETPFALSALPDGVEDQFKHIEKIIRIGNNDCEKLLSSSSISHINKCLQSFAILEHVFIIQLSPVRWKHLMEGHESVAVISNDLRMNLLIAIEAAATIYVMIRIFLQSQLPSERTSVYLSDDDHFINLCFMNVWFQNILKRKESRSCGIVQYLQYMTQLRGSVRFEPSPILGLIKCGSAAQSHACASCIEMMQTTPFRALVNINMERNQNSNNGLFVFKKGDPWYDMIENILELKSIQSFDDVDDVARIFTIELEPFRQACPEFYHFRNMHIMFMLVMRSAQLESSYFEWERFFSMKSDGGWSAFACNLVDLPRPPGVYPFQISGLCVPVEGGLGFRKLPSFALSFLHMPIYHSVGISLPSSASDSSPMAATILQISSSAPQLAIPLVLKLFHRHNNISKLRDSKVRKSLCSALFSQGLHGDPQVDMNEPYVDLKNCFESVIFAPHDLLGKFCLVFVHGLSLFHIFCLIQFPVYRYGIAELRLGLEE
jgi:hypothetical protein